MRRLRGRKRDRYLQTSFTASETSPSRLESRGWHRTLVLLYGNMCSQLRVTLAASPPLPRHDFFTAETLVCMTRHGMVKNQFTKHLLFSLPCELPFSPLKFQTPSTPSSSVSHLLLQVYKLQLPECHVPFLYVLFPPPCTKVCSSVSLSFIMQRGDCVWYISQLRTHVGRGQPRSVEFSQVSLLLRLLVR